MKKKIVSLLLTVLFLLNTLPLTAFAADDFAWELTENGTLILTGSGPMPNYTGTAQVPWYQQRTKIKEVKLDTRFTTVGDYAFSDCIYLEHANFPEGLTRIGNNAFSGCTRLASIPLPDGITEIGARAFSSCRYIRHVTLPKALTVIGANAFNDCTTLNHVTFGENLTTIENGAFWSSGLYSADLPESLVTIGDGAFRSTWLSRIVIPDGVKTIGDAAFMGTPRMKTASIPASVTEIGEDAFSGVGLQRIDVAKDNRYYASDEEGVLFDKSMHTLIRYPAARPANSYTIPEGVEQIADSAFTSSARLTSLTLPDSLETIGTGAFLSCDCLQYMVFPERVSTISGSTVSRWTDGFVLKSAVFEGNAPDGIQPADLTAPSFNPDSVMIYYFANKSGWSYPTWNGYDTCPILMSGSDSLYESGYYSDLGVYHFTFTDYEGTDLSSVTVTVDGISISSGDSNTLSFAAMASPATLITITRSGYYPVELPLILFDYINDVSLYPLTYKDPFVQAAFIKKSNQSRALDLLYEGTIFHAGDLDELTTLYLDINWAGRNPGDLFMSQTLDMSDLISLQEGCNAQTNYSVYLTPGKPLYIHMLADGGIYRRELPVSVIQAIEELPLDTGEDFEIPMPEEDKFLSEFDIGLDLFDDLEVSISVASDGSVEGVIGVEIDTDSKTTKEVFDDVADELNRAAVDEYEESVTNVSGIIKRFAKGGPAQIMPPKKSKLVITGEASLIGYFTGTLELDSEDELYVKFEECKLGIAIGGKITKTFQMYTPQGVPFYVGSDWTAKAEFIPTLYNSDSIQLFVKPAEMKGTIEMKVRGGLGWDSIASVGIYGKGGLYLETLIPVKEDVTDLYVNASFGAEARVFCFSADFEICKTDNLYLIGGPDAQLLSLGEFDLANAQNWAPQQRDYLNESTLMSADGTALFENIYPYTALQYGVLKNGTEILVWTGDDGTREDNNRTSLFYSYKTAYSSSWLKPKKVETTDDGTGDFNPVLYVSENKAYLAWQNASRALTAQDTLAATAEAMDITVAELKLPGYQFSILGTVGTAGYDGAQSLTLTEEGDLCVVWASSTASDIFAPDGSVYALNRAVFTEDQIAESQLAAGLGYIDQTCCDGGQIWFAMDTDLEGSTLSDREIFLFEETLSQLTENDVPDTTADFSGTVNWYHNGTVQTPSGQAPLLENTDVFQYLQSPSGLDCVVYTVTDSKRITGLYASFNGGIGWGEPVLIAGGNGNIGSFDALFLSDGTLRIAVSERAVSDDLSLSAGAGLQIYTVAPTSDLTLQYLDYQPGSLMRGGTLNVFADIQNSGSAAAELIQVSVYDGETLLDTLILSETLPSGVSETLIFPVKLGESVPESLRFEVTPVEHEDANMEDNTGILTLYHSDLSLENARVRSDGTHTELVVLAANRGLTGLSGFTVTAEDASGNVLASFENIALSEGGSEYLSLRLDTPVENGAVIRFKATAPSGLSENILANNEILAKATARAGMSTSSVTLQLSETASGANVTAEMKNAPFGNEACLLLCALYDKDGKMLSAVSGTYQSTSRNVEFSFPVSADTEGTVKLFALNEDYTPISECAVKTY